MKTKTEGLLLKQMEAAWRTGELVAFHRWNDEPDLFWVGFVRDVDSQRAILLTVDTCGRNERDFEVPLSEIQAIRRGTAYLMGLTYLNGIADEIPHARGHVAHSPKTIQRAVSHAGKTEEVLHISFESGEHGYFFVRDCDNEFLVLESLVDGMPDGIFTRRLDQIASLREGSDREIAEQLLYRASQGLDLDIRD